MQVGFASGAGAVTITYTPSTAGTYTVICSQESITGAAATYSLTIPAPALPVTTMITIGNEPEAATGTAGKVPPPVQRTVGVRKDAWNDASECEACEMKATTTRTPRNTNRCALGPLRDGARRRDEK